MIELYPHQLKAVDDMSDGCVLYGGVGSGKTLTGLAYYLQEHSKQKLIVITTAKKRNTGDWTEEAELLGIDSIFVDSWQNVDNYTGLQNAFFIFDEQRVVGSGKWVKAFLKITKKNDWILLSGTPGDKWEDYIPIFIANGMYKNKTDFSNQHLEYSRFTKFPQVIRYHNEGRLIRNRHQVLVRMEIERHTTRHKHYIKVDYPNKLYLETSNKRWNPFEDKPIANVSEYMSVIRQIVNTHPDRITVAQFILDVHDKIIVFYNYNYELDILIDICERTDKQYAQYNGRKHEDLPTGDEWIYIVQYTAGAEGWNCIETDTMLFFSLNYSYKIVEQCEGRLDRLNTPYKDLQYYFLLSNSPLDVNILKSINKKKSFNTSAWTRKAGLIF